MTISERDAARIRKAAHRTMKAYINVAKGAESRETALKIIDAYDNLQLPYVDDSGNLVYVTPRQTLQYLSLETKAKLAEGLEEIMEGWKMRKAKPV